MLTEDKSFKQIFPVTHTNIESGDYHLIMVNEVEMANGKLITSQFNYKQKQQHDK